MMKRIRCAGLLIAALPMAAQIAKPQLGYVMDSAGDLRPVIGMAAAASLGDAPLGGVSSFACSANLCLAKTDAALVAFAPANTQSGAAPQATVAPAGAALMAIDDPPAASSAASAHGSRAWVYFAAAPQMALWQNGALTTLDFAPGGEVLSLRAAVGGFDYIVLRHPSRDRPRHATADAWIEHYSESDGHTTVVGPAATGASLLDPFTTMAMMLIDGGVLTALSDRLILQRPDGSETAFPLNGAQAFYRAGAGYVEIVATGGLWMLRTDTGQEKLAMLPGTPQAEASAVPSRTDKAPHIEQIRARAAE